MPGHGDGQAHAPADEAAPASAAAQVDQINQTLDELAAHGLLSDERAAQAVLNLRAQRYGQHRLRQDLQAKGLAPELVSQTLEQARGSELERARLVWQRKFGQAPADAAGAARHMRFLAGRGFEGEVVRQVLRQVMQEARTARHVDADNDGDGDIQRPPRAGPGHGTPSQADGPEGVFASDMGDADPL